jgi:hypothetical protein
MSIAVGICEGLLCLRVENSFNLQTREREKGATVNSVEASSTELSCVSKLCRKVQEISD